MDERQEFEKPFCGFCDKRFTSSRVLQNHMKTHFSSGASDGGESLNPRDLSCYYGLRDNPKKTQRSFSPEASLDHSSTRKNLIRCKECGKGFRYEKCLSKHHAGMHSGNQKVSEESRASLCGFSLVRRKRSRIIRYKKTRLSLFGSFPESRSVSATKEELEIVECLILLSKSRGSFLDGLKLVGEVLEANSETPGIQDSLSCLSNKKLRTGGEFDHGVLSNQLKGGVSNGETSKETSSCLGDKDESKVSPNIHPQKLGEVELTGMCLDDEPRKWIRGAEIDLERKSDCNESGFQVAGSVSRKVRSNEATSEDLVSEITGSSPFAYSGNNASETKPISASYSDTETLSESQRNVEHRCRTCDKIFPSYQALGGHQTLHRMRNKTAYGPKTEKHRETIELKTVNDLVEYKCSICSRVFRSVHALGGHKKCHHLRKSTKAGDVQIVIEEEYFGSHIEIDLNVPVTGVIEQY